MPCVCWALRRIILIHRLVLSSVNALSVPYLVDVLMGKADERVRQFEHDKLAVFGLGAGQTQQQWQSLFRQLIALGFLTVDVDGHGGLQLSESARPVLRAQPSLLLPQTSPYGKRYVRCAKAWPMHKVYRLLWFSTMPP
jgi:ATP-dependent DNA helicase RecQ